MCCFDQPGIQKRAKKLKITDFLERAICSKVLLILKSKKMKRLITIGIAALLLGLVLSVPLRVNALEDKKSIIEGEIAESRRSNSVISGLCFILGAAVFAIGALLHSVSIFMGLVANVLSLTFFGIPFAFPFIILSDVFARLGNLSYGISAIIDDMS
jgi:hypothetical protein